MVRLYQPGSKKRDVPLTYIDVPQEVCRSQGEVDVLRQGELLTDPPGRQHSGGPRVLGGS